jgi:hypothetical protein
MTKTTNKKSTDDGIRLVESTVVEMGKIVQVEGLLEKAAGLVASFVGKTEGQLAETENAIANLISGALTVEELSAKYGSMSVAEAAQAKEQLALTLNSIQVEIEKQKVAQSAIMLNKQKAFTALAGLRASFEIEERSQQTMDAKGKADFAEKDRLLNDDKRQSDLQFKSDRNSLDRQEQESKLAHKAEVTQLGDRIRTAVQKKLGAIAGYKEGEAEQVVRRLQR